LIEIRYVGDAQALRSAYEGIYTSEGICHSDSFYRWILGLVQPERGKRLLDIACGQGRLPILATGLGIEAHGMDLSAQALRFGLGQEAHLVTANGQRLPYPDEAFDYVTNIGSLEHYADPAAGAREMARVLCDGGLACVLLPNTFSLLGNMLYAWHNGRTADDGQPIQRYAARYEWEDLLLAGGLSVRRTVKYECERPRTLPDLRRVVRRPKAVLRLLLSPFVPLNLANSFVYLCRKGGR
jgi:SAM-dependent methyltransferase